MTERSESERAELVALAQAFLDRKYVTRADSRQKEMGLAYIEAERQDLAQEVARFCASEIDRRLAAQDQKPVAWIIPTGDNVVRDSGFIDCMAWEEGEFTKPLYAKPFPPPAAGWDAAIEACKKIAEKWLESVMGGEVYVARSIVNAIEALSKPTPVAANASAEARLRGALEAMLSMFGRPHKNEYVDGGASYKKACEVVAAARKALSTHPHASDCDKQGEAKCPECGGSGSIEIDDGHFIKCKCASAIRSARDGGAET